MIDEVLEELNNLKWKKNINRPIASGFHKKYGKRSVGYPVYSMTFGKTFPYDKPYLIKDNKNMIKNPELYDILKRFAIYLDPDFDYTNIMINKNFQCLPHKDRNKGLSMIIGLGQYEGGELVFDGEEHDIRNKMIKFDGRKYEHYVKDFIGTRYSIIYFKK